MSNQHTLFVCKTCASTWKDGKRIGKSGGENLLENLTELAQEWDLRDNFQIKEVECMSACNRSCVVAFAGEGKITYLFGDLPYDTDNLTATSTAVLSCASKYYTRSDGLLPWAERPEPLKKGVLARIPPIALNN